MLVNPTLGYRLDPGEPGLAYSAPASRSILRVLSQEISNLVAFKKEAMREGGYVVYSNISLDLRKRGSFLAAVAGRTQVLVYKPVERILEEDTRREIEDKINQLRAQLIRETNPLIKERLEEDIRRLEIALTVLKSGLKIPELLLGVLLDTLV